MNLDELLNRQEVLEETLLALHGTIKRPNVVKNLSDRLGVPAKVAERLITLIEGGESEKATMLAAEAALVKRRGQKQSKSVAKEEKSLPELDPKDLPEGKRELARFRLKRLRQRFGLDE